MRTELFDYRLPQELIAQTPMEPRGASRLLAVDCETGGIEHRDFADLEEYLEKGDCMVFNRSRVRRARLRGHKREGGGRVELLLLREMGDGIWEALARPARRMHAGTEMLFGQGELMGRVVQKGERGIITVALDPGENENLEALLERLGEVPLPPYIRNELKDPDRYQTVFASETGSAAAPTAGLHFEKVELESLEGMGVGLAYIRLDVGLDTFRPIEEEEVEGHRLHREWAAVDRDACEKINQARAGGHRVVAVGTTTVRALESAVTGGVVSPYSGETGLYIYPGYRFKAVDCLLTNFHLPRSTLLVLVCAFAGRDLVLASYREAVERRYRFLSFGDACMFYYPRAWRPPGDSKPERRDSGM